MEVDGRIGGALLGALFGQPNGAMQAVSLVEELYEEGYFVRTVSDKKSFADISIPSGQKIRGPTIASVQIVFKAPLLAAELLYIATIGDPPARQECPAPGRY
jgi:hypothetical protein